MKLRGSLRGNVGTGEGAGWRLREISRAQNNAPAHFRYCTSHGVAELAVAPHMKDKFILSGVRYVLLTILFAYVC
jgi:hypothetical protein